MKLSEALRIGIQKRPKQCFGKLFESPESSCALGAILDAHGLLKDCPEVFEVMYQPDVEVKLPRLFRGLNAWSSFSMFTQIMRLNDIEELSREQIASWLEAQGE